MVLHEEFIETRAGVNTISRACGGRRDAQDVDAVAAGVGGLEVDGCHAVECDGRRARPAKGILCEAVVVGLVGGGGGVAPLVVEVDR